jgi:hypothetical protein
LISTDKIVIPQIIIPTAVPPTPIVMASASINNVTVEFDVLQSSQRGMRIHTDFGIAHGGGMECQIIAYFRYANGSPLLDQNLQDRAADGQVSLSSKFTPPYEYTRYKDYDLFLPYDELHLSSGQYDLTFKVVIFDLISSTPITRSENTAFSYRQ